MSEGDEGHRGGAPARSQGRRHGVEIGHPPGAGDELPVEGDGDAEPDERAQFRKLQATTTTGTDHEALRKIRIDDHPRPPAVDLGLYPALTVPGGHAVAGEHGLDVGDHDAQHARETCERRSLDDGALFVYEYNRGARDAPMRALGPRRGGWSLRRRPRRDEQRRREGTAPLAKLGLSAGDRVRFRRRERGRWREGVVSGMHKDGSIALHDEDGQARALFPERLELRTTGPRGAATWEPLLEHAARPEQLGLL